VILRIADLANGRHFVHGFSTSQLGSMRRHGEDPLTPARRDFALQLGLDPRCIAFMGAVHGADVVEAAQPGLYADMDGLVTSVPGIALFATFADCYPVLLYDLTRRRAGLAHAGWRGTAAGVTRNLVAAMGGDPAGLVAGIGPGICGKCYEVSEEVARRFPDTVKRRHGDRWLLDLSEANRLQLVEAGLKPANVHLHGACTKETPELASHRRTGDGSRFACLLALV
jgi:YfiH family protein